MFCTNCGKELRDEWERCPYCGKEIKDNYFKKKTVLLSSKSKEAEESEKHDFNEEGKNQGESHTYEILAVRRGGNYRTREIVTTVDIDNYNIIVNKGKKREKSFHLKDIKSYHFAYQPIWWVTDFIRIILFALLMPISYGTTVLAVLLSVYAACSKHLIFVLSDGTKIKIPMRQKADAAEVLEALGCSKEEINACNAKKVSTHAWNIRYLIISMLLFLVTSTVIGVGIELSMNEDSDGLDISNEITGDMNLDVQNGLLYSNEDGWITDKDGNVIAGYEDITVLPNGALSAYDSIYENYFAGAGGKIIFQSPQPIDYGESAEDYEEYAYTEGIPENPNKPGSTDDAIRNKVTDTLNDGADGFMNNLLGWFIDQTDDSVDKRNIGMYYGSWYDEATGTYIYITDGNGKCDYIVDLSSLGYGEDIEGTFTSSQTIYMGGIGMGIIMNEDGSIYVDNISISGREDIGGHYIRQ